MRTSRLASLFLLSGSFLVAAAGASGQSFAPADAAGLAPVAVPKTPISFDETAIDKSVDPCKDFYKFSCGNWDKNNPIPDEQVRWGTFNQLAERNQYLLYEQLKAAADAPKSPLQKKYGDYFAACIDEKRADELGAKPIAPELAAIAAISDKKQLAAADLSFTRDFGSSLLFLVAVGQDQKDASKQILQTGQGGLALPDRDYYLVDDERSKTIRTQYVAHVTKMFVLLGATPAAAAAEAASVMTIETALAQGSMSRVDLRDPDKRYHIMTIAEVAQLSPDFNWQQYLDGQGLGGAKTMNVSSPGFVKTVNDVIEQQSLPAMQSYFRWRALHGAAPLLSEPFVTENFNFFSATLQGQKVDTPRWKRCTRQTDAALGEAVGQDWVRQNFPPDAKANMEKLVTALETAMAEDLKTLPWMSDQTKAEAKLKLDGIRQKIGYPENWRDYSSLKVTRDDAVANTEAAIKFERARNLAKLGKPVDEKEWVMTPPTVNAYYSSSMNDINFPAGILQPPFYDNKLDPAVNFGAIGAVIGHEMTHGFDDQGSKFDAKGNRRDWFTQEDLAKFNARTDCEVKEYSGFEVAPGQNLNGKLTLGENTADNGGLRIAYLALEDTLKNQGPAGLKKAGYVANERNGYTPEQRFFIGFGQVWCSNQREQAARVQAKTDPHSTGEWRVKGTVQNFEEFGKAFGCKAGELMTPVNACRVW